MSILPVNAKKNAIRPAKGDRLFNGVVAAILVLVLFIAAYPLYFTVIASLSDPYSVVKGKVFLWPVGFSLDSYRNVLKESSIWTGYLNSIKYTVFGTLFNLALTIPTAYVMSKKRMLGYRIFSTVFLICMYFGGGLTPTYLQIKSIGLLNKSYTMIFLGGFSIYNMIITRVYFESSIPNELSADVSERRAGSLRPDWRNAGLALDGGTERIGKKENGGARFFGAGRAGGAVRRHVFRGQ